MITQNSHPFSLLTRNSFRTNIDEAWTRSPFPTLRSSQALLNRLRFILRREAKERWLPVHLRNQIKNSCERMMKLDREGLLNPSLAQSEIEKLATIAYEYNDLTLRSSTLCQIRALDMEMNEERYKNLLNTTFQDDLSA